VIERVDTQPIADAGPDQTVAPGAVVQLDGTGSSDADGDLLRFSWSLVSQPLGSTVSINDTGDSKPALSIDRQGPYEVALVVHDGKVGSVPDTVVIRVACSGDCKGDNQVTVDELLTMVNIALGNADVATCDAGDANSDRQITIDEIIAAVNNALNGCQEQ
jgi:hypothetical protein